MCIRSYRKLSGACATLLALCALSFSGSATAQMAQSPLFLGKILKPNIMFTLDNSGSMAWDTLTSYDWAAAYDGDTTQSYKRTRAHYASGYNQLYYNPAVSYSPPKNADGTDMPQSGWTAANKAWVSPYLDPSDKIDISETCYTQSSLASLILPFYNPISYDANTDNCKIASGVYSFANWKTPRARYAFYYVWDGITDIASNSPPNAAFPTRVDILASTPTYSRPATRTDCAISGTCTYLEEIKNFANWFSYYRTRINAAKTGVSQAFADLDASFRIGYGEIRAGTVTLDGVASTSTVKLGVRDFQGTERTAWYDKLQDATPNGGTPLRRAVDDVGQYFSRSDIKGPWAENPGVSRGTEYACRKSFHILTTDGYWNNDPAPTAGAQTGDSVAGLTIAGTGTDGTAVSYKYDPTKNELCSTSSKGVTCAPCTIAGGDCISNTYYNGGGSASSGGGDGFGTLADAAMYYWKTDLRTDIDNKVPTSSADPAFWQHVTQYTVGLGVKGAIEYTSDNITALKNGSQTWPLAVRDTDTAVDDLWHAAVNGRGLFFSARNPVAFRDGLSSALRDISKVTAVAATETASSSVIRTGVYQYEPSFLSGSWLGHLRAYDVVSWDFKWDAATCVGVDPAAVAGGALRPAACGGDGTATVSAVRNIVTMNDSSGSKVNFNWDDISGTQRTALGSAYVLNYLRGDGSKERTLDNAAGIFRERLTKLGDIVNSAPLYVKNGMDQGYSSLPTIGAGYISFLTTKSSRKGMIYVGANDGMLHAFDATVGEANSGKEVFAYVPASVYPNLKSLSATDYVHKYFVDGQQTESDAYLSGGWKTILLGSTGAGAKSMFAIDITNPTELGDPLFAKDKVLWEKSAIDDSDMGYMLGEARVVLLKNGKWVAITGNGYGSSNGHAVLSLKELIDGNVYRNIPTDSTTANGLSTPALVYDSLNRVIAAYAGDLQGNLWKFDLSNPATATGVRLFTAKNSSNQVQPIIQRPVYKQHPQGGYMVMFGTGKFFDSNDINNTEVQSLYGIWDNPADTTPVTSRAALQEQVMTDTGTSGGTIAIGSTVVTSPRGWYLDLKTTGAANDPHKGERAIANPVLLEGVFITKTLTPVGDLCIPGGSSYLYGINYLTGGANSTAAFTTLDIVRLSAGGTAGLQVVQSSDGRIHIKTKPLGGAGGQGQVEEGRTVSPGYRTWRQIPVAY